ncbi:MAG: ubiquinone/menaquinone biosynthesis methyltransferase [Fidelibacterota bacterium]
MRPNATMERAPQGELKTEYVKGMFTRIARRYDLMNRLMTAGRDQKWRRRAVGLARIQPGGRVLDLATGTGDLGLAVLEHLPTATVTGVDFLLPMLRLSRQKAATSHRKGFHFAAADALDLPFPDKTFDAVLSAFLMRNVADLVRGFQEQRRVLRPGGRLVCLEITLPETVGFRKVFGWYFHRIVPVVGGLVSGSREAYTYLPESVQRFPPPAALANLLRETGLREVTCERLMGGTVTIHAGTR